MGRTTSFLLAAGLLIAGTTTLPTLVRAAVLDDIEVAVEHPKFSIILVETSAAFTRYQLTPSKTQNDYVELDLYGVSQGKVEDRIQIDDGAVDSISVRGYSSPKKTRLGIRLRPGVSASTVFPVKLDAKRKGRLAVLIDNPPDHKLTLPSPEEARQWRNEGKRIVIIDPGHGWLDPGAAYYGMQEKTIVLDVAKKLAELINQSDNMRAYLTRYGDYMPLMDKNDYEGSFLTIRRKALKARLKYAQEMHGDIFVSLHVNAARRRSAKGFEVWYMDERIKDSVAAEAIEDMNLHDLQDYGTDVDVSNSANDSEQFLIGLKRDANVRNNKLLAENIAHILPRVPGLIPREKPVVASDKFIVLKSIAMPGVLVEMAFLSNRDDAAKLRRQDFRWRLAQEIYNGIGRYFVEEHTAGYVASSKPFEIDRNIQVPNVRYSIHVVEKDETLFTIAQKYNTSIEHLKSINNMTGSRIYERQEINVPEGATTMTATHVVRTGESLSSIADDAGMSVSELKTLNGMRSNRIYPGDELILNRQGKRTETVEAPKVARSEPPAQAPTSIYTVRRGDTLSDIAKNHGMTVSALKALNNKSNSRIMPGDKLVVSGTSITSAARTSSSKQASPVYYKVRKGDSLYDIARKYRTSVEKIKSMNGLRKSRIDIGQKLRVR